MPNGSKRRDLGQQKEWEVEWEARKKETIQLSKEAVESRNIKDDDDFAAELIKILKLPGKYKFGLMAQAGVVRGVLSILADKKGGPIAIEDLYKALHRAGIHPSPPKLLDLVDTLTSRHEAGWGARKYETIKLSEEATNCWTRKELIRAIHITNRDHQAFLKSKIDITEALPVILRFLGDEEGASITIEELDKALRGHDIPISRPTLLKLVDILRSYDEKAA